MPRIILKHKSPEFADNIASQYAHTHRCDMPGCSETGDHKAPKHRGLNEYYHFCFDHVRDYNKAWDFFSGMSERDIQSHLEKSLYGDRPTWRYDSLSNLEDDLLRETEREYTYSEKQEKTYSSRERYIDSSTPEHEALSIMGLTPPVTLEEIKMQYRKLAKKYHPDLNRDDPKAEDLLKKVNMAYTILKLAFDQYKHLPDHKF